MKAATGSGTPRAALRRNQDACFALLPTYETRRRRNEIGNDSERHSRDGEDRYSPMALDLLRAIVLPCSDAWGGFFDCSDGFGLAPLSHIRNPPRNASAL